MSARLGFAAAAALLLAGAGCTGARAPDPGPAASGDGVLFVGNSLTGANDLPRAVAALSEAAGTPLRTAAVVAGGASLEDHWNAGSARTEIRRGGWRAVVVQQGPSTLPESRESLVRWTGRYAGEARRAGAEPYVYMVWPPLGGDWESGIASYRAAADATGSGLFPVAEAFRAAWRRDPELALLAEDGFHPAPLGTYLAAVVMVAQLTGRSPAGLPRGIDGAPAVDPDTAAVLQEAAAEAIWRHGRRPGAEPGTR
jgi:hypothetical protein